MSLIELSSLKKDQNNASKHLKVVSNSMIVTKDMYILFPARFEDKNLAYFNETISVVGFVAIVIDNVYTTMKIPTYINVNPSKVSKVKIEEVEYYKLDFDANNVFIDNINLVKSDGHIYFIFEEFFIRGNIPFYFDYSDPTKVFDKVKKYCGSSIGKNPAALELFTAIIARYSKNRSISYRHALNKNPNMKENPVYTGLLNVFHTFNNNLSKIGGSYLSDGIPSAIDNNDSTNVSSLEKIYRV